MGFKGIDTKKYQPFYQLCLREKHAHHGFTLAEVLITLTIIGVIAAITIPTLMKNYEKHQIEVGLAKTYQELSNVIKRSEADNGEMIDWNGSELATSNTQTFIQKYISPYIKLNACTKKCFKGKQFDLWLTQPNKEEETYGFWRGCRKFRLDDGRSIAIISGYDSVRDQRGVNFFVDVNGSRGNGVLGEDVFQFSYIDYYYRAINSFTVQHRYRGLYAGSGENGGMIGPYFSRENTINKCKSNGSECSILLMLNNWKFPDDYPIKF